MSKVFRSHYSFALMLLAASGAHGEPLAVEASLDEDSLRAVALTPHDAKGRFKVLTRITNPGKSEIELVVYTCGYGASWIADQSAIRTGVESCRSNVEVNIRLRPGKSYERPLELAFTGEASPGPLSFRLGFNRVPEFRKRPEAWSGPVAVEIKRVMLQDLLPMRSTPGGVTLIQKDVKTKDLPLAVRELMVESDIEDIPLPELKKKEASGQPLSERERALLKKSREARGK